MISTYQVNPSPDDCAVSGVVIDGAVYGLQGQPPVAVSGGWGNLSFMLWSA